MQPSARTSALPSSQPAPLVSIVIATHARLSRLQRCVAAIRRNVRVSHEVIVVGGAAPDGTAEWAAQQPDIVFIHEPKREGATRAYNRGFRRARGRLVMWLNDDSYPLAGSVEAAVATLERPDLVGIGMVAFYHNYERAWNCLERVEHEGVAYGLYNVRGMTYANFGLLRRELLESLGYLDERYYFCAWDPDLSLKVQIEAGLRVVGCRRALVYHEELIDERKSADMRVIDADNKLLFEKWRLPERFGYPDPAPAYCAMADELRL